MQLTTSKQKLDITDIGAGSHKLKSSTRKVSDIAKHVSISRKNAQILYRITKYFKAKNILELGTSLGCATHAMGLANPKSQIHTIEGCTAISKYTQSNFHALGLDNIRLITGDFSNVIPKLSPQKLDLIFFDGNHKKDATLEYFEKLLPNAHNDSLFIFDDIYWSKGMTEAWASIKQHPKVTVTIDIFQWGLVFFREEQAKEHFYLRV